jgi:hypothetical protein
MHMGLIGCDPKARHTGTSTRLHIPTPACPAPATPRLSTPTQTSRGANRRARAFDTSSQFLENIQDRSRPPIAPSCLLVPVHIAHANMSVTTTANPIHYTLHPVLADYDLHHTESLDTSPNAHPAPSTSHQESPADWPTEHRRVPAYRPINTELDQSERRVYQNGIERTFIAVMFTGVFLQSVSP